MLRDGYVLDEDGDTNYYPAECAHDAGTLLKVRLEH